MCRLTAMLHPEHMPWLLHSTGILDFDKALGKSAELRLIFLRLIFLRLKFLAARGAEAFTFACAKKALKFKSK